MYPGGRIAAVVEQRPGKRSGQRRVLPGQGKSSKEGPYGVMRVWPQDRCVGPAPGRVFLWQAAWGNDPGGLRARG